MSDGRFGSAGGSARNVPLRALVLSGVALAVPLIASWFLPPELLEQPGLLVWLCALIPGFLLSYHKGWSGSALSLAAGMAVLSLSHLALSLRGLPQPLTSVVLAVTAAFLVVSIGLGWVTELLHRDRRTAEGQALTDVLTELPNRRHAEVFLARAIETARQTDQPLCVVAFDLDHFKWLNDTHGHGAGDKVLRAFADLLRVHAEEPGLVARIGGEEFLAILPGQGVEAAAAFADRVREDLLGLPLRWQPLTVSAGVADWDARGPNDAEGLITAADAALYQAKELGRDRVEVALRARRTEREEAGAGSAATFAARIRGIVALPDPFARSAIRRVMELSGLYVEEFADVDAVPLQLAGPDGRLAVAVCAAPGPGSVRAARVLWAAVGDDVPIVLFTDGAGDGVASLPRSVVVVEGRPTPDVLLSHLTRVLHAPLVRSGTEEVPTNRGRASRLGEDGARLSDARVMVVDDERPNRDALRRILEGLGFSDLAILESGEEAVAAMKRAPPDLLVLDLHMGGMDGFEVLDAIRPTLQADGFLPVLVVTGDQQWELRQRALRMGAKDFLNKPFDISELGARVLNLLETRKLHLQMRDLNQFLESRVRERTREVAKAKDEILFRLARAAEYRDDVTGRHAERVGVCSMLIATALGLPEDRCEVIRSAAPLHDVGKIAIPDAILLKKGPLTDEEMAVMRGHTRIGADLMSDSSSEIIEEARVIALSHHERWDGGGYPGGLVGEAIPLGGRIVALADALDALTHVRPYSAARPFDEAWERLRSEAGTAFDPDVVDALDLVTARVRDVMASSD